MSVEPVRTWVCFRSLCKPSAPCHPLTCGWQTRPSAPTSRIHRVPRHEAEEPRDGPALVGRWWAVDGDGLLFYIGKGGRHASPQCNENVAVVERLIPDLYPAAWTERIPVVFLGRDGICGQHEAAGLPATVPQGAS